MFNPDMTNAALLRMRKAHDAGRGVRLSAEELDAFSVENLGAWWTSIDEDGQNTNATEYNSTKETNRG